MSVFSPYIKQNEMLIKQNNELRAMLSELSEAVKATREGKRDGYTFGALSNADDKARALLEKLK